MPGDHKRSSVTAVSYIKAIGIAPAIVLKTEKQGMLLKRIGELCKLANAQTCIIPANSLFRNTLLFFTVSTEIAYAIPMLI